MDRPVYHLEKVVRTRSERVNFDGPLDLILTLLSRNRVEIEDIQISLLLEQYLAWMEGQRALNLDVASEFAAMASQLLVIKTRMLLRLDEEEPVSELEELVAALEQRRRSESYERVKRLLPTLGARYEQGSACLTRGPLRVEPERSYRYRHEPEDLLRTMKELLRRGGEELPPPERAFALIVGREPYPVDRKSRELMERLAGGGVELRELFRAAESRSELVASFLAVLELCKLHRARLQGTVLMSVEEEATPNH